METKEASKPAVISTPEEIPEINETSKPQIPPKPVMPPIAVFYPKYKKIKAELDRMNGQIFDAEREKAKLEIQRDDPCPTIFPSLKRMIRSKSMMEFNL